MPADGNGGDPEEPRNRGNPEPFELVHDDDRAAPWCQAVEGPPDSGPCDPRGLLVDRAARVELLVEPPANGALAPLIAADVDENADEPRLFPGRATRYRRQRAGGPEKRLLDEVQRLVRVRRKPAGQAVQPLVMSLEQLGQAVHISVNARRL